MLISLLEDYEEETHDELSEKTYSLSG